MSEDESPESESAKTSVPAETLAESFAQSKQELKFILSTWLFFFAWVGLVSYFLGYNPEGKPVPTLLGMPSWVLFGIALPWLCAIGVAIFFASRIMKDTNLEGESNAEL